MAEAGSVDVDGTRTAIQYETGIVTSTRKQKETQIHSNTQYHGNQPVTSTSSSTVDHHEMHIRTSTGTESAYQFVDLDVPVREGHTITVVWILPENAKSGPYVQIYNHNTGDNNIIEPKRLLPWYFKKKLCLIVTIGGTILGFMIFWPLGLALLIGPYVYLKRRALTAIRGIFSSREFTQLQGQLSQVKPTAAAAA